MLTRLELERIVLSDKITGDIKAAKRVAEEIKLRVCTDYRNWLYVNENISIINDNSSNIELVEEVPRKGYIIKFLFGKYELKRLLRVWVKPLAITTYVKDPKIGRTVRNIREETHGYIGIKK